MRILGIVITYKPNIGLMIKNIERYVTNIDTLIIWINTPSMSMNDFANLFCDKYYFKKLILMGDNVNRGLSYPLNYARKYAIDNCYDYLLTMDQDSYIVNFDYYINTIEKYDNHNCIYCMRINDDVDYSNECDENYDLINSGSIYGILALQKIGTFNELFFVDGIDTEYCIRAILCNIKIYMINNAKIIQSFGDHREYNIWGKKYVISNYSYRRLYGIIFSNVVMFREFPIKWKMYILKRLSYLWGLNLLLKILVYESDKIIKIKAILKGYKDGFSVIIPNQYKYTKI